MIVSSRDEDSSVLVRRSGDFAAMSQMIMRG